MPENLKNGFFLADVEIRPEENLLLVEGNTRQVEPKSMEVLLALADAGSETVSREELTAQVWPRGFVTDDVLTRCISQLRNALGDRPKDSKFIVTVPRKGYRLAQAARVEGHQSPLEGAVVLPFQNLSSSSEDYIADGLTELLIARLSVVLDQAVISRTTAMSFKDSKRSLDSISRQLGVRWVVEGSVMQLGDQVQIIVQLIDSKTDHHVWAETWTRPVGDLLSVLNEISRLVAGKVRAELHDKPPTLPREDSLPTDLLRKYLHGVQLNSKRYPEALRQANSCFEDVLRVCPDHAASLSGQSMSQFLLAHYGAVPAQQGFRNARKLARKALEYNPGLADAIANLAAVDFFHDWSFEASESRVRQALDINPGMEMALLVLANIHQVRRRHEKAQACIDRALEIDPLNIGILMNAGDHLILQRRFGEASTVLASALEIERSFRPACLRLAIATAFNNDADAAMRALDRAAELGGEDAGYLEYLAIARGRLGHRSEAIEAAERLESPSSGGKAAPPWARARAWASAGRTDSAVACLEEAFQVRSSSMPFLGVTPVFDEIRSCPAVQDLMRRVGVD